MNIKKYKETVEQIKKQAIEYKFELILCGLVVAGTVSEIMLYSAAKSPWWGLLWLLPIYGMYKHQLKTVGPQQKINT